MIPRPTKPTRSIRSVLDVVVAREEHAAVAGLLGDEERALLGHVHVHGRDEKIVGHVDEAGRARELVRDRLGKRILLERIDEQRPRLFHEREEFERLKMLLVGEEDGCSELLVAFMDLVEEHLLSTSVPDYHWRISMQNSPKTLPSSVKHTVRREPGSKVTLDVEVAADRLSRAADAAFERHVQRAKIPGFRPGKAPRGMYERAYGKEHLWEDAADDLMDQTYREIVEAEGIEPIDRPDAKLTQLKEGEPLRYTATVVVRPDVTLGDYLAHGATVEAAPPTDEDVERTIASMRDTHAQLRPVDREARAGDILTVDIDAAVPGKALPPFARNAHIEAGKDLGMVGLGEALVGMKLGDEKKVDLTFPNDASENDLAGKTGTFSIRPSQVAEKILPELDDEFAKTVGVADVAALRKAVRNELAHAAFHEARDEAADKAVEHAMATSTVEIPELLIEDELEHLVNDLKARIKQEGMTWEKFLLQARKTEDEIRTEWRPVAERRAKSLLVLDAIARKEGITVSGDELAAQAAMSPLAQVDPQALRSPAVLASLARSIRNRKTVDKLVGLDSPDAEREAIRKAGGDDFDFHGDSPPKLAEPKIIVPEKSDATPEGREALRAMLEKK
ncbi:MAG: trigger factor [Chloroflexi bacterium]|nr:MAG: trigger factor [Chloroflexota bacterium]TMG50802.1 MAG: trigger factor [Chloroflexota bacterium]